MDLTVDTLNVALAGAFIPHEAQRRPAVLATLAAMPSDVVCLQEAWNQEDKEAIVAAARMRFPHAVHYRHDLDTPEETIESDCPVTPAQTTPPCGDATTRMRLDASLLCLAQNCSTMPGSDQGRTTSTQCAAERCIAQASGLLVTGGPTGLRCYGCLAPNLPTETFASIRQRCTSNPRGELAFNGQSGVMILSRYPLSDVGQFVLPGTWNRRVILRATATLPNGARVAVYCNHLTPRFESVAFPYTGRYGCGEVTPDAWAHEQLMQARHLVRHVNSTAGALPAVILGDINSSPAVPAAGVVEEASEAHAALHAAFPEAVPPGYQAGCTFCPDNSLNDMRTMPVWLDHIYLRNIPVASVRSLTRTYTTPMVDVPGGMRVHLSDHFGMRAVVSVGP
jgi:endonuclease/exonuclease/phosphatase family metal-dependent hydrolase